MGPTHYIKDVICTATNLLTVFIGIVPSTFFSKVAEMTEKYSYKDWLVEQRRKDLDGNEIGRHYFVDVPEGMEGAHHRTMKQQYKICPGFIIVFIGILLTKGVLVNCGNAVRTACQFHMFGTLYDAQCIQVHASKYPLC